MRFGISTLTILTITVAWVKAAPVILEKRAPELEVSLRESHPETTDWHFGLVIHVPGGIPGKDTVHHQLANKNTKCLEYTASERNVKAEEIKVTAEIHLVHEKDAGELYESVTEIVSKVPNTPVTPDGNFANCLDFAVTAVRDLATSGHVTNADYERFVAYHNRVAPEVRRMTEHNTVTALTGQTYTGSLHPPAHEGTKRGHTEAQLSSSDSSSSSSSGNGSPKAGPSSPKRQRRPSDAGSIGSASA